MMHHPDALKPRSTGSLGTCALLLLFAGASAISPVPSRFECNATELPTFCDPTQPNDARIAELLSKMSLEQKVAQVGQNGAPAIEAPLSIPEFQWWGEALHGVCESPAVNFRPPTPFGTSFPEIIGVGSAFDKELWAEMGGAVGLEAP